MLLGNRRTATSLERISQSHYCKNTSDNTKIVITPLANNAGWNNKMKKDFWLERWKQKEIGFHQDEINPYLIQYWQELHPAQGSEVFVPLCGKSRDMLWLRKQGAVFAGRQLGCLSDTGICNIDGLVQYLTFRTGIAHRQVSLIRHVAMPAPSLFTRQLLVSICLPSDGIGLACLMISCSY